MKKAILSIISAAFVLTACATNPPQWWDPRGTYADQLPETQQTTATTTKTTTPKTTTQKATASSAKTTAASTATAGVVTTESGSKVITLEPQKKPKAANTFTPVIEPEVEYVELPPPSVLME
ncbi:hypothetical protein Dip510_001178 [Elusimicrobium posterum]|uniref:hypothetical protein n=1 Tax=Elusimicrobium posterum TaxID=3116653 RepID=UPI003C743EFD